MKIFSAVQVAERLPYPRLIAGLREAFCQHIHVPPRSMHKVDLPSGSQATFGLMPAWRAGEVLTAKLLTIFPENAQRGMPTIHAQIILFDGTSGIPIAIIDGTEVTRRRTAAASALAATFLAREEAEDLLVVGTGAQAPHQVLAHMAVRPIRHIAIWGRSVEKARQVVETLALSIGECSVDAVSDLESAARKADVISCVTSTSEPLVFGEWLKPGVFLDLVGSHTPDKRECDDEAARRSRIYVDTLIGAMAEAGDVLIPLRQGTIHESDIVGDLYALCRGEAPGRLAQNEITLFKSVGSGVEDLAAARLVVSEPVS